MWNIEPMVMHQSMNQWIDGATNQRMNELSKEKFRSQTSDYMDRWKAEAQRVREEKKEDQGR